MIHKRTLNDIDINEMKSDSVVCVYGAGKIGVERSQRLQNVLGIRIQYFCDRDQSKWGNEILPSIKCLSPLELAQLKNVVCILLIGQYYKQSALNDLAQYSNIKWVITFDDLIAMDSLIDGILQEGQYLSGYASDRFDIDAKEIPRISNKTGKKVAVYTCITGGYEKPNFPQTIDSSFDYYCIIDQVPLDAPFFNYIEGNDIIPCNISDNTKRNRFAKILGNYIFEEYDYSIYVDGNVQIVGDLSKYMEMMNKYGIMSHMHVFEDCIYSEAIRVIANGKDDEEIIKTQMNRYRSEGMPRHFGMLHNAILVRDNRNKMCKELMRNWWKEVMYGSKRDQLSLTYCLWKMGIKPEKVGTLGNNMRGNSDFVWTNRHNKRM